ncbi:hypothetical protein N7G274_007573 [Stereocaulon virgatum]|uniref:Uncharacterized protein n=1 Tax=Stereocaulon virgatum TaxID=373712 RepID=A0ABR4A2I6_9LECA
MIYNSTINYILNCTDESVSRTILNFILMDRLNDLQVKHVHHKLLLCAEVALSIKALDEFRKWTIVKGRADWALGYGSSETYTGSLLMIAESEHTDNALIGIPQMSIYMVAVQEARRDRDNKTVWEFLSDGSTFYFASLNDDCKLLTSRPLMWRNDDSAILTHIDIILLDAGQVFSSHDAHSKWRTPMYERIGDTPRVRGSSGMNRRSREMKGMTAKVYT